MNHVSTVGPRRLGLFWAIVLVALPLAVGGCTTYTGSGGGGIVTIGGAPGIVCDPTAYTQGCAGVTKVSCDATTKTWISIGDCAAGQVCIAGLDPAAPNTVKRIAKCVTPAGAATDAGGTSTGDATVSGDAGPDAKSDGGVAKTDATVSDTGPTKADTTATGGPWVKCVMAKCASQWASCQTAPACVTASACVDGCGGDKKCQQLCFDNTSGEDQNKLISVIMCADSIGCSAGNTGPKCGNSLCESGETTQTCPQDCKQVGPQCGNGKCEDGESNSTCPNDCKPVGPQCGNGKCEQGETTSSCLADCKPVCGDGKCELGEAKNTCPQDCGPKTVCGNGTCESGETSSTCPQDCGPKTVCGNGTCESGESASSCPSDCGGGGGSTCLQTKCATEYNACTASQKCLTVAGFAALQGCADTNKCADSACVQSKCGQELTGCQNDTGCNGVLGCLNKCKDQACQQKCLDPTGVSQYDGLVKCAQTKCPTP